MTYTKAQRSHYTSLTLADRLYYVMLESTTKHRNKHTITMLIKGALCINLREFFYLKNTAQEQALGSYAAC